MSDSIIDKNYEWFQSNLSELVQNYEGQYIVVKDCRVIGTYPTFDEAFTETNKNEAAGTYIIQLCSQDENKIARTYHTLRVSF